MKERGTEIKVVLVGLSYGCSLRGSTRLVEMNPKQIIIVDDVESHHRHIIPSFQWPKVEAKTKKQPSKPWYLKDGKGKPRRY